MVIKMFTDSGEMIIELSANYMSHGDNSFCGKILNVLSHSKYG